MTVPKKQESNWSRVPDHHIRHIWKLATTCLDECADRTVEVDPDWYANNGTPICGECGTDMVYSHTEIRNKNVVVHVRGGVAYPPGKRTHGVRVRVVDRD